MKSNTAMPLFNQLFEFDGQTQTTQPQKKVSPAAEILNKIRVRQADTVECEIINGRARAKLSRDQADAIVDLVNKGRTIAQDHDKWTQEHLDIWDAYWEGSANGNGIEHTLTNYHNPNVTLKQLLWCVNSITKTQTSKAVPKFVKESVRELRKMEKEGE
jgi:ATP phosphoribosyltransferase